MRADGAGRAFERVQGSGQVIRHGGGHHGAQALGLGDQISTEVAHDALVKRRVATQALQRGAHLHAVGIGPGGLRLDRLQAFLASCACLTVTIRYSFCHRRWHHHVGLFGNGGDGFG